MKYISNPSSLPSLCPRRNKDLHFLCPHHKFLSHPTKQKMFMFDTQFFQDYRSPWIRQSVKFAVLLCKIRVMDLFSRFKKDTQTVQFSWLDTFSQSFCHKSALFWRRMSSSPIFCWVSMLSRRITVLQLLGVRCDCINSRNVVKAGGVIWWKCWD